MLIGIENTLPATAKPIIERAVALLTESAASATEAQELFLQAFNKKDEALDLLQVATQLSQEKLNEMNAKAQSIQAENVSVGRGIEEIRQEIGSMSDRCDTIQQLITDLRQNIVQAKDKCSELSYMNFAIGGLVGGTIGSVLCPIAFFSAPATLAGAVVGMKVFHIVNTYFGVTEKISKFMFSDPIENFYESKQLEGEARALSEAFTITPTRRGFGPFSIASKRTGYATIKVGDTLVKIGFDKKKDQVVSEKNLLNLLDVVTAKIKDDEIKLGDFTIISKYLQDNNFTKNQNPRALAILEKLRAAAKAGYDVRVLEKEHLEFFQAQERERVALEQRRAAAGA